VSPALSSIMVTAMIDKKIRKPILGIMILGGNNKKKILNVTKKNKFHTGIDQDPLMKKCRHIMTHSTLLPRM
jgi:hypothetical protein